MYIQQKQKKYPTSLYNLNSNNGKINGILIQGNLTFEQYKN